MSAQITDTGGIFGKKWEEMGETVQDLKEGVGKRVKEAVNGGAEELEKIKKGTMKLADRVEKMVAGEKKDYSGTTRPPFLAGMLLDSRNKIYFKMTRSDFLGGGGKIALWIRHFLLTHIRETGAGDRFLASLASSTRDGVEAVWKDVLVKAGIPSEDHDRMIGKLMEETSWTAITLIGDRVKEKVQEGIEMAISTARKIEKEAYRVAIESGSEEAMGIVERTRTFIAGNVKVLEDIRSEIQFMPLSKYNALLDFKPVLAKIMKEAGAGKVENDFLSAELESARKDATISRVAGKAGKVALLVAEQVAWSAATAGIITPATRKLVKVLWKTGEYLLDGKEIVEIGIENYKAFTRCDLLSDIELREKGLWSNLKCTDLPLP